MSEWLGDWVVCPRCDGIFFENDAPHRALIAQHRSHNLMGLDRAHVSPSMTHAEAVAVAWALKFEREDLRSKGPPEELSMGFRPQAWADARNEHAERVSASIAVVYEGPSSRRLYGLALVDDGPLVRAEFGDTDQAEAWLAEVMRRHGLNHCEMMIFGSEHRAFWAGRVHCSRVQSLMSEIK
jgi:hypothetical protein